jgi:hypothetical protein
MARTHLITLVFSTLAISACANAPEAGEVSSLRPVWMECPRMAPMGSKIKSKVVCSQDERRKGVSVNEEREIFHRDDVLRSGGLPGGR